LPYRTIEVREHTDEGQPFTGSVPISTAAKICAGKG